MKLVASSSLSDSFWARKSKSSPPDTLQDTGVGWGPGPIRPMCQEAGQRVQLLNLTPTTWMYGRMYGFVQPAPGTDFASIHLCSFLWMPRVGALVLKALPEGPLVTPAATTPWPPWLRWQRTETNTVVWQRRTYAGPKAGHLSSSPALPLTLDKSYPPLQADLSFPICKMSRWSKMVPRALSWTL